MSPYPPLPLLFLLLLVLTTQTQPLHLPTTRRLCFSQPELICHLRPTASQTANGQVTFRPVWRPNQRPTNCQVEVDVIIRDAPFGPHGIHIHTYGDLASDDGSSLGGHFNNPWDGQVPHGFRNSTHRHWGDFGSLSAGMRGMGRVTFVDKVIRLRGIVGRGMVLHAGLDKGPDYQPSGDSGSRIAACVIGFRNTDL